MKFKLATEHIDIHDGNTSIAIDPITIEYELAPDEFIKLYETMPVVVNSLIELLKQHAK